MGVQRLADLMRLLGLSPTAEDILDVLLLARLVGAPAPAVAGTAGEGGRGARPAARARGTPAGAGGRPCGGGNRKSARPSRPYRASRSASRADRSAASVCPGTLRSPLPCTR